MKDKITFIIIFLSIISLNLLLIKIPNFYNNIDSNYKIVNKNINQEINSINSINSINKIDNKNLLTQNTNLIYYEKIENLYIKQKELESNSIFINNYNTSTEDNNAKNNNVPWLYIGISVGGISLILLLIILVVVKKRKNNNSNKNNIDNEISKTKNSGIDDEIINI